MTKSAVSTVDILDAFRRHHCRTLHSLISELQVTEYELRKALDLLVKSGLVIDYGDGRYTPYYISKLPCPETASEPA